MAYGVNASQISEPPRWTLHKLFTAIEIDGFGGKECQALRHSYWMNSETLWEYKKKIAYWGIFFWIWLDNFCFLNWASKTKKNRWILYFCFKDSCCHLGTYPFFALLVIIKITLVIVNSISIHSMIKCSYKMVICMICTIPKLNYIEENGYQYFVD